MTTDPEWEVWGEAEDRDGSVFVRALDAHEAVEVWVRAGNTYASARAYAVLAYYPDREPEIVDL